MKKKPFPHFLITGIVLLSAACQHKDAMLDNSTDRLMLSTIDEVTKVLASSHTYPNVRVLCIGDNKISIEFDNEHFKSLSKKIKLQGLQSLHIHASKLTGFSLSELPNLGQLDLSACAKLQKIHLQELPNLHQLSIARCTKLTQATLQELDRLANLDLSECSRLSKLTLNELYDLEKMNLTKCNKLKEIELVECHDFLTQQLLEEGWETKDNLHFIKQVKDRSISPRMLEEKPSEAPNVSLVKEKEPEI